MKRKYDGITAILKIHFSPKNVPVDMMIKTKSFGNYGKVGTYIYDIIC